MFKALTIAAALLASASAALSQEWRHEGSGISGPEAIGDMHRGEQRDLSDGRGFDVFTQYGTDAEPATLYIYRAAYPNPALWFERTRMAMNVNVGSGNADAAPRPFTLGGGSAPNGLREEIELPAGGRFRSTAVAMAQIDEWIVKARITSARLDRAGVAARMDALLGALRLPAARQAAHPLQLPGPCGDSLALGGQPVRGDRDAELASAMASGIVEYAEARGGGGLAGEPGAWCRDDGTPQRVGSLYRRRDGSAWVMLLGDSGMALTGRRTENGTGAAAFASTSASTRVIELYDALPAPQAALDPAVPVFLGRSPGLIEISLGGGAPR